MIDLDLIKNATIVCHIW